jgi:beta-galactosidase
VLPVSAIGQKDRPRIDINIDHGWRFIEQDVPSAKDASFDDSSWQSVSLPHTWNVEDGARHGAYYRGPGWYRKQLQIGNALVGKSLFLRFEAASLVSDVYVNGHLAGHHAGGFGAFCFDITQFARPGTNFVAVRVDNSYNPSVTPLSGDFTIYGGLYREVHLLALNPVHIDPTDDASPGVFWTPHVTSDACDVSVRAEIVDSTAGGDSNGLAEARFSILDARGAAIVQKTVPIALGAGHSVDAPCDLVVLHPHLWDGVRDPYLYRGVVE